jgi:hypothetical protein
MSNLDLNKLSAEELEQLLAKKRDQQRREAEKKKAEYEASRHDLVVNLAKRAKELSEQLQVFKDMSIKALEGFRQEAQRYGDIRSNSKGGFSLRDASGKYKVSYERNTISEYDERADLAEDLLRDFLGDMIKKRDAKAYEIITGLLERGKAGDYNPAAIAALLKMEDKYTDERWQKAMKLFKESFNTRLISMNVSFFEKDGMDKDRLIGLTFSSLPVSNIKINSHE